MSLISWNVNGLRAAGKKGFLQWLEKGGYDMVALQETKISDPEQLTGELRNPDGYFSYFHCAKEKKGYSGVAIYTKEEPRAVRTFFQEFPLLSTEGRVMEMEFEKFILFSVYFPNGGGGAERLRYKLAFYEEFLEYIKKLTKEGKNVIFCGDVNTAHNEIDLARPKENEKNTGFLRIERDWMDKLTLAGFCDTFRFLHTKEIAYSWWDLKTRARERNVGWRLDYFFVNESLRDHIKEVAILGDVYGSDHCPVSLSLSL
ncbi:MAG: exodeoxyribonuclease III [Candidatus Moraniibacteriota bacterium]|nr:MAG: exodeoxyribonuclease III [Candidatus Moranbacteria bacterium]